MAIEKQATHISTSAKAVQRSTDKNTSDRFIRFPEVVKITGLSRGSIYKQINLGTFPKNISLGGRATGFLASEVLAWVETRVAASRAAEEVTGG